MPRQAGPVLQRLIRSTFDFWQWLGVHITPNHYYSPIPDTAALAPEHFSQESELPGIVINANAQRELFATLTTRYRTELHALSTRNESFGVVDAELYYALIRHQKPRKIIEIGAGRSTEFALAAIAANRREDPNYGCVLTAIEPYPSAQLKKLRQRGVVLMQKPVQMVDRNLFEQLGQHDILFIDSSHVVKAGSDVQYEYLELLPRLARGVLVHIHDIYLPREYPHAWIVRQQRFWNEQYLLQAFLAFNRVFSVVLMNHWMHLKHPELLKAAFPQYQPTVDQPGSLWVQKTG